MSASRVLCVVMATVLLGVVSVASVDPAAAAQTGRSAHHHRPATGTPSWVQLARLDGPALAYPTSSASAPELTVQPSWQGFPLTVPVVASGRQRVEVRMPPGVPFATGWLPATAVTLLRTPYRIEVDLRTARVLLYERGRLQRCAPAEVGASATATPSGHFYVLGLVAAPSRAYGPFVIVTSALAPTATDWEEGGWPVVTVNGPIDGHVPVTGAHTTSGSVRVDDGTLNAFGVVAAGTPLVIAQSVRLSSRRDRRLCTGR